MALMLGSLRDAPTAASAPHEKAQKAAGYESRIARVEADLVLVKRMLGVSSAMVLAILLRVFFA